ncbi:hypothetical protein [Flavobacterium pectinovorum]|uniref:Uncharacterized protein n=1 Tax=Flavobacterium pectinovorum TaxID=29533 RepID=A0A502EG52_9FLAO|nr:hypothetical protein [Flavobacterium pectinovorum]TPG35480.1 hypothetical protein EAH81_20935 [Flavobacterium pectinovorum]
MEINETKTIENLRKLTALYFNTLKPSTNKTGTYTTQIKMSSYSELGCVITETLKLCIVALDHEAHKTSDTIKTSPIDVALVLEMVLEMFPTDELEILDEINQMLAANSQILNE